MRKIFPSIFLLFPIGLILLLFVSCSPVVYVGTETRIPNATFEALASPIIETPTLTAVQITNTACPFENWPCPSDNLTLTAEMKPTLDALLTDNSTCSWPCPSDSLTLTAEMKPTLDAMMTNASNSLTMTAEMTPRLSDDSLTMTAAMGLTFTAISSNTPPPGATVIPSVGDLGWGSIYGKITDGVTNLPIEGAIVRCEHSSYSSPYPCSGITTTNADGIYAFTGIFFHDTDRITLIVEAPGYTPLHFEQGFFTRPEFHADLGLDPVNGGTSTPTPFMMCTAPACSGGVLACGKPNGCTGGCGTICLTTTSTPY
jgi:hypothetical protein